MVFKVEQLENNRVKLEITVDREEYQKGLAVKLKEAGKQTNIPGFRKGKAPRHILERYLGKEYLENEAAQPLIGPAYIAAVDEADLDPITLPDINITQVGEGQDLIFSAEMELQPPVTLGAYLDLKIDKLSAEITDEQVDQELQSKQEQYAKIMTLEEGAIAQEGDALNIDFIGYKDGQAFEGGSGEDYTLTLGSKTFIPGFEEQLVGIKIGDEFDINVVFPEDYPKEDLKGQPVIFHIKVHSGKRKELVPLDDEFAKDVSEFETLAEYREDLRATMLKERQEQLSQEQRAAVLNTVVDNAAVEIPESMVSDRYNSLLNNIQDNLVRQGININLDQYCQLLGIDAQTLRTDMRTQALKEVKTEMVFEAIARQENITCSEEELKEELTKMYEQEDIKIEDVLQMLEARGEKRGAKKTFIRSHTVDFLISRNLPIDNNMTEG